MSARLAFHWVNAAALGRSGRLPGIKVANRLLVRRDDLERCARSYWMGCGRPNLLIDEYQRRLAMATSHAGLETERKTAALALKRVKAREDRVTGAYINDAMELDRYKAEMGKLKDSRRELERVAQEVNLRQRQEEESHKALEQLEQFCRRMAQGLEAMTFEERQRLLRMVVERITMEGGRVQIATVIPTGGVGEQLSTRHHECL